MEHFRRSHGRDGVAFGSDDAWQRLFGGNLKADVLRDKVDLLVGDFEFVGLVDDFLVIGQQFVLGVLLVERLEVLVDLRKVKQNQFLLHKLEYGQGHLEKELGPVRQNVVPDADAEAEREAVQEASLEPLVDPKQIG